MPAHDADVVFAGSIPQFYEHYLAPLIFAPYAADLASRVALRQPARVLEIAAGTGVVTRQLARALPSEATIIATDLNQPMLDQAAAIGTARPVEWRQADAMDLPFAERNSQDAHSDSRAKEVGSSTGQRLNIRSAGKVNSAITHLLPLMLHTGDKSSVKH